MTTAREIRRANVLALMADYPTNRAFADAAGLPATFVSQIKTQRRNVGDDLARSIEQALRLPRGYLDVEHNASPSNRVQENASDYRVAPARDPGKPIVTWEQPSDLDPDQYVLVQRRKVHPSAGDGRLVFEEETAPPLAFTAEWIKRLGLQRRNLVIVNVHGDSMEPSIRDGDAVLVDLGTARVRDGNIYVLRYGDELRIKRLFRRYDGALIVRSDNSEKYPDETIPPQDLDGQVEVIGRVVWRAGSIE